MTVVRHVRPVRRAHGLSARPDQPRPRRDVQGRKESARSHA